MKSFRGLSHDRLSRSVWTLYGANPVERQKEAQDRVVRAVRAKAFSRARVTVFLAVLWAALVALSLFARA